MSKSRTKYQVLFYVLFTNGKYDILGETVTVPNGASEREIAMEASMWLDRRLERLYNEGKIPNVVKQGLTKYGCPEFAVHSIYPNMEKY